MEYGTLDRSVPLLIPPVSRWQQLIQRSVQIGKFSQILESISIWSGRGVEVVGGVSV